MEGLIFKDPWMLLVIPLAAIVLVFLCAGRRHDGFVFPTDKVVGSFKTNLKLWLVGKTVYVRAAVIILVVLAMARPQAPREDVIKKEGIAVMMAIDVSSTMVADDIEFGFDEMARRGIVLGKNTNARRMKRIDAAKEVARDFIEHRPDDLIGLVAFASEAFVACPLTFDKEWLMESLERVQIGMIKDGTAIGSAILAGMNSLKNIGTKTRIIILLTDGINNSGRVPAPVAAEAARTLGIKIYTIGIASEGEGFQRAEDGSGRKVYKRMKIDIDEKALKEISRTTGGEYFRAKDLESLRGSYEKIDKLERSGMEQKTYEQYVDLFQYFLITALILLFLDIVLSNTLLRRIP